MSRRTRFNLTVCCLCFFVLPASDGAQAPRPRLTTASSGASDAPNALADSAPREPGGATPGVFQDGTLRGAVSLEPSGTAVRNAVVTIAELQRSVLTDENGAFEFGNVPAGKYQIVAHLDRVPDVVKRIESKGGDQIINFQLSLAPVREEVIVTASGSAESVNAAYQS